MKNRTNLTLSPLPLPARHKAKVSYALQVALVDVFYGTSCFMSRGYWDVGTAIGDFIVSVSMVFLYHCAKACIKESRKERQENNDVRVANRTI